MTSVSPKKGWEGFRSDWQLSLLGSDHQSCSNMRKHLFKGLLDFTCQISLQLLGRPQPKRTETSLKVSTSSSKLCPAQAPVSGSLWKRCPNPRKKEIPRNKNIMCGLTAQTRRQRDFFFLVWGFFFKVFYTNDPRR